MYVEGEEGLYLGTEVFLAGGRASEVLGTGREAGVRELARGAGLPVSAAPPLQQGLGDGVVARETLWQGIGLVGLPRREIWRQVCIRLARF